MLPLQQATFVEWVKETIPRSFWAKACYEQHRAKGASHNATLRALAFKWIRILYRCWIDRTPYDESRYLEALKKRGSPLLAYAISDAIWRLRNASGRRLGGGAQRCRLLDMRYSAAIPSSNCIA